MSDDDDELAAWQKQFDNGPGEEPWERELKEMSTRHRSRSSGFSQAEKAAMKWRQRQRCSSRSRSPSSSSSSSSPSSYRRPRRRAPTDPRRSDHCDRRKGYGTRRIREGDGEERKEWTHDKYGDVLRDPSPERQFPDDYRPPEPEWFSRAGGVCIPNTRASWINDRGRDRD